MINPQNSRNVAPNIRLQRKMLSEVMADQTYNTVDLLKFIGEPSRD